MTETIEDSVILTELCKHGNVNKRYNYKLDKDKVVVSYYSTTWPLEQGSQTLHQIGSFKIEDGFLKFRHRLSICTFDLSDPKFNIKQATDYIEHLHKPKG